MHAKRRDPDATRAAILEAAERIFVEKGFAAASTAEIADAAEVTKSLIHHYFGSKEGLWDAVKEHRFEVYAGVQRRMLEETGSSAELLRDSVETYFRFLAEHPRFVRFMSWMFVERDEEAFGSSVELIRLGVDKIREAQEAGELRGDVDPFYVLVSFLGLVEHWFQAKGHRCAWAPPEHAVWDDELYLPDLLKIFFEGVLPRDPS